MPTFPPPGLLRRLPIFALLLSVAPAALAQLPAGAVVQSLPKSDDPAELLAQALRTLATEPANLSALTVAGHNALALGDPNAAVGFFGRAQEIAPRDGAIKAGLGSALVQLEKPQDALRLFADASRLGVPDVDIAEDRGLAYDLTGQQSLAQRDYQTVLAVHPEDEAVRRRLALSQGISGNKAGAIATLDPLIRKRDIAGWRAQTFVLAMNGDAKGAGDITRIMLPQQAAMLQPFLVRLATLSPADKARAVHFGEMPATGTTYTPTQVASVDTPATYASAPTSAPSSDLAPLKRTPVPAAVAKPQPRRTVTASSAPIPATPATTTPAATTSATTTPAAPLAGIALTPAQTADQAPAHATGVPTGPQIAQAAPVPPLEAAPVAAPVVALPTPAVQGHYDLPHDAATKSGTRAARPLPAPVKTVGTPVVHGRTVAAADDDAIDGKMKGSVAAKSRIAAIDHDDDDAVKTKARVHAKADADDDTDTDAKAKKGTTRTPDEDCAPVPKSHSRSRAKAKAKAAKASVRCEKPVSTDDADAAPAKARKGKGGKDGKDVVAKGKKADADADDGSSAGRTAKSSKSDKPGSDKSAAERIYVQVAGGANKDDMDKAWADVKKKAPVLMKDHKPLTTPLRATNRLLVGPFKTEDEAQAFVNKMAAKGLSGFTFKSGKGQKVEKIDTAP
ncbi:SPOR domain-containing protein [Sphingomonas abietis]|uniref:SPOR domain-containing protein n=1 Tax=Sphingomonas abietis TaxID=3012344 RepID=A0ABY7NTY6_9SPHN|nr:SPOR domain-containing protein [Sphingomonas abietis]WBO23399.1 SPOR domain-containing protein [Sphingomonas abietis]